MLFELAVPKHYDLLSSVHSWIYPDIQPVPEQTGDTFFARIYKIDRTLVPLVIYQEQSGQLLRVNYPPSGVSKNSLKAVLQDVLGLKVRMNGAIDKIRQEPMIAHIAPLVSGIQPYISPTVNEALVKTIIQQQISYRAANVLTKRMVIQLSQKMDFSGRTLYAFPESKAILICGIDGLRAFGLGYKAEYINEVNKLVCDGTLKIESLKGMSFDEISAILKPIRGIGEWTIRTLAIAGLGDYTVFPCDDLGVRNLMGRLFNAGAERMKTNEVEDLAQSWGKDWPLVLYLLMSADVLGLFGQQGRQQMHKRTQHIEAKRKTG
ncbi:MAG: DNA-3-methyladenine glycosylase family protein [Candidatus Odinarchaeota archaeon]